MKPTHVQGNAVIFHWFRGAGLKVFLRKFFFYLIYALFLSLLCLMVGCFNNDAMRMGIGYLGGGGAFL